MEVHGLGKYRQGKLATADLIPTSNIMPSHKEQKSLVPQEATAHQHLSDRQKKKKKDHTG